MSFTCLRCFFSVATNLSLPMRDSQCQSRQYAKYTFQNLGKNYLTYPATTSVRSFSNWTWIISLERTVPDPLGYAQHQSLAGTWEVNEEERSTNLTRLSIQCTVQYLWHTQLVSVISKCSYTLQNLSITKPEAQSSGFRASHLQEDWL